VSPFDLFLALEQGHGIIGHSRLVRTAARGIVRKSWEICSLALPESRRGRWLRVYRRRVAISCRIAVQSADLKAGEQRQPAYLQLNPNGLVPTLLIGGRPFTEAAALLMIVAMRHPQAGLAPEEVSDSRDAWHQWIVYFANTLQPAFRLWFYPSDISDDENTQAILKAALRKQIERAWARIATHLGEQGPYLLGEEFSAADLMLIMLMRWSRDMPKPATEWEALNQYAARMRARPSWKKQLYALEGLSDWS
jgi:glutathione S-transferase